MLKSIKEEVIARMQDKVLPDAVLVFYKEPHNEGMVLQPGDNLRFSLAGTSVLIQNTSPNTIYIRGEQ